MVRCPSCKVTPSSVPRPPSPFSPPLLICILIGVYSVLRISSKASLICYIRLTASVVSIFKVIPFSILWRMADISVSICETVVVPDSCVVTAKPISTVPASPVWNNYSPYSPKPHWDAKLSMAYCKGLPSKPAPPLSTNLILKLSESTSTLTGIGWLSAITVKDSVASWPASY
jgi:hypothetical protein